MSSSSVNTRGVKCIDDDATFTPETPLGRINPTPGRSKATITPTDAVHTTHAYEKNDKG